MLGLVDRDGEVDIFSGRKYWRQFSILLDEREGVQQVLGVYLLYVLFEHSDFLSRLIGVDEVGVVDNGFCNAGVGCTDFVCIICMYFFGTYILD